MALFPNLAFGVLQGGGADLGPSPSHVDFKYPIKRRNIQRTTVHVFADLSEQRYLKGAPLAEFEMTFRDLRVEQKDTIRLFYDRAGGDVLPWSMNLDNQSFYNCRFLGPIEFANASQGLWDCVVRIRGFNADQNQSTLITSGPGARIIVPAAAGSMEIAWNPNWNLVDPAFTDGTVTVAFDGSGGATIAWVPGSGGDGQGFTLPDGIPEFYNRWGYNGTYYIEPLFRGSALFGLTPGPVSLGTGFVAGQEIILQMITSGGLLTNENTVFFSGPGFRNPDGQVHASVL